MPRDSIFFYLIPEKSVVYVNFRRLGNICFFLIHNWHLISGRIYTRKTVGSSYLSRNYLILYFLTYTSVRSMKIGNITALSGMDLRNLLFSFDRFSKRLCSLVGDKLFSVQFYWFHPKTKGCKAYCYSVAICMEKFRQVYFFCITGSAV